ncbi:hypothetical protein AMTRI_Chr10g225770 [Amborella trichopoda]|uniref:Uncharacterized protein n=1 Tax=Amborella trichopoda TaxID=13333 RepID=W1PEX2_AMBTC|nr:uncharacterized protein LOC18434722 [Amborella trichopoda]ERN06523.1 hypothetical protein AMTR_s00058p00093170 [Amborella trichopoda]|eukprot:XP_006844848.1 uncharacterized protein LOC18434722 [Amborella trichopoda]
MAAAALPSIPAPKTKILHHNRIKNLGLLFPVNMSNSCNSNKRRSISCCCPAMAAKSSNAAVAEEEDREKYEEAMSTDALHRFINLNLGDWNGSFYQFDAHGNMMQNVTTKLAVSSYGEDELISLIQTLYIKQPPSRTSISGYDQEPEWAEYKIKETNMFTVDKYQQIGFFPQEKAFSLRYQTAGMLETVLRAGVLGEDDIGEESPKNLKLPCRHPSVVCENCLYLQKTDVRARAFHIMDPKGVLEMFLIFLEQRGDKAPCLSSFDVFMDNDSSRLDAWLGQWKGHSITKRSGVYGATIAKADTNAILEMKNKGQLIQDITSTSEGGVSTNVHWTGTMSGNLISFDGGFQMTLLPGGMYLACPSNVGKSVAQSQSFHLEFCWMVSPFERHRLVRTYDVEGLAVSTTYVFETKQ